ncbi:MAG TPA: hypothetical protein VLA56_03090 [Pseudomonadales bacterium]|nr:hypothetical protein [Pseudomonadales bacterium]
MGAGNIEIREQIPASRKLGIESARELVAEAGELIVARGKKVVRLDLKETDAEEAATAMLGPTGNLRAPTMKVGRTLVVGFDQATYETVLA